MTESSHTVPTGDTGTSGTSGVPGPGGAQGGSPRPGSEEPRASGAAGPTIILGVAVAAIAVMLLASAVGVRIDVSGIGIVALIVAGVAIITGAIARAARDRR